MSSTGYFWAAYVKGSDNIRFINCTFSLNLFDTTKTIIYTDGIDKALGGGIIMDSCRNSTIEKCTLEDQNVGLALYGCDSIVVDSNSMNNNSLKNKI